MNVYFLLVLLILSHCSEDACFHSKLPPPCGRMTSGRLQPSRTVLQLVPLRLDLMLITSVASASVDQQEER